MTGTATGLGTFSWVDRTGGQLSAAERRSLLRPLAQGLAVNAAGRLLMLVKLNSGRRAQVVPTQLLPPSSALTRAAEVQAHRRLSPALLNHSYRTFAFGAALGALENLVFDRELLFAAALLHDVGLPTAVRQVDFTLGSARVARDVAEDVGLSSAATETIRSAITLHPKPERVLGRRPGRLPAVSGRGGRCRRPPLLAASPGAARLGRGPASAARLQARVFRRVPHRGGPRPTWAREVPAQIRGVRPCDQARPVHRLTQPWSICRSECPASDPRSIPPHESEPRSSHRLVTRQAR